MGWGMDSGGCKQVVVVHSSSVSFMTKVEWSQTANFEKIQGTAFYTNATSDHVEAEIHGLGTGNKYFCRLVK